MFLSREQACSHSVPDWFCAWLQQYLELYLWPHFHSGASVTHVLSMMLMVNEKFRENMPGWSCFTDVDKFGVFFQRCAPCSCAVAC